MDAIKFRGLPVLAASSALLTLAMLCMSGIVGAQSLPVNRDTAWFKPTLTVDSAPICKQLLQVEQDAFFSAAAPDYDRVDLKKLRGDMYDRTSEDPQIESVAVRQLKLTLPDGQRVFVYFQNLGGCGGGCEAEQVLVASQPFAENPPRGGRSSDAPYVVGGWKLFKSPQGQFYTVATVDDRVQAYRIAAPSRLEEACEVIIRPTEVDYQRDPAVRDARLAVESLRRTYGPIAQGGGSCGSLNTAGRVARDLDRAMEEVLYRPWAVEEVETNVLEPWSLNGLAEHRSFNRYLQQLDRSALEVGKFFRLKYGWPEVDARDRAVRVLRGAFNRGFSFYSTEFPGNPDLRQAILERRPISEIKALRVDIADEPPGETYDSTLNIAVEYPDALRYLLDQGLDPNVANDFGKTPLMYAAQFNQQESVRILLAAGANPNALTHVPGDVCFYDISTSGVTPLHYAVRYASAPLIRTLVSAGAATFNRSRKAWGGAEEYPIDWLERYTVTEPSEKNPNLAAAELPALFDLLRVPSDEDRQLISADLVKREQAEYARGDFKSAYSSLTLALSAQSSNEKALADRPLVALKAGHDKEALDAAQGQVKFAKSIPEQAMAWFNLGLICQRNLNFGYTRCDDDWLWPFVQAWRLQPTRTRAEKLLGAFDLKGAGSCAKSGESQEWKVQPVMTGNKDVERIYILHTAGDSLHIEPDAERVIDNLAIRDRAITVLERPVEFALPSLNGRECRLPKR